MRKKHKNQTDKFIPSRMVSLIFTMMHIPSGSMEQIPAETPRMYPPQTGNSVKSPKTKKHLPGRSAGVSSGRKDRGQIPWSIMASATLRKPAMFAPMT